MYRIIFALFFGLLLAQSSLGIAQTVTRSITASTERLHPKWEAFEPRYQSMICPFASEGGFDEDIVKCGYVLVPEDRTDADSRLIRIAVMRIMATTSKPSAGTVLRLDGGPGWPSISAQRAAYYSGPDALLFREAFETVFFDQRGIGYSDPDICRGVPEMYQFGVPTGTEGVKRYRAAMQRCFGEARSQGATIEAYNSWQSALDVRDLRRALGHRQWNIFGISYGTELGQAVLQVDSEGTRAAVFNSVVPTSPDQKSGWTAMAPNFRTSLDAVGKACEMNKACSERIGNLTDRFANVIASYGDNPMVIEGLPTSRFENGRVIIDDVIAANSVFQIMYNRRAYADLPVLLDAFERRDRTALTAYASVAGNEINQSFGVGMRLATICRGASRTNPEKRAAARAMEPQFAPWFEPMDFSLACEDLEDGNYDPSVRITQSDVPVLIAAGDADPITPASYSQSIRPGLPNSQYVEFPHTGHSALFSNEDCGRGILIAFLNQPTKPVDTDCVAQTSAPDFVTDWRSTSKAYNFVTGVQKGARPIVPALLLLGLAFAFVAYPIALVGRLIQSPADGVARKRLARPRLYSWLATMLAIAALGLAAWLIQGWATDHFLAFPSSLPSTIALAGWLAVIAVAVAGYALWRTLSIRSQGVLPLGTLIGAFAGVIMSLGAVALLWTVGAGPF